MKEYDWHFKFKHFKPSELECKCKRCKGKETGLLMDTDFMTDLEHARVIADVPFRVTGYRCRKHNAEIKGSSKTSEHCNGLAVDISYKNLKVLFRIIYGCISAEFMRIQIYRYKNTKRGWVHVDKSNSSRKPKEWFNIKEV